MCKLCDFGNARRITSLTEPASTGSASSPYASSPTRQMAIWVAPEIMRAAKNGEHYIYDCKADIWGLGCVVLEMVAGKQPWGEAVMFEVSLVFCPRCAVIVPQVTWEPRALTRQFFFLFLLLSISFSTTGECCLRSPLRSNSHPTSMISDANACQTIQTSALRRRNCSVIRTLPSLGIGLFEDFLEVAAQRSKSLFVIFQTRFIPRLDTQGNEALPFKA